MTDTRNNIIDELQDFMLTNNNINKYLESHINNFKSEKNVEIKQNTTTNNTNANKKFELLFIPKQQDTLFWCYYIIKNGDTSYEMLHNKNSLLSKQMKIELVDVIRKNKDIVKIYKFDTITNIENNLANDQQLNVKTFLSLAAINNINIIYVSKKTYYELLMNDTNISYIVYEIESQSKYNSKFGFELANENLLSSIRRDKYKLDKLDKPIKSESAYKVQDLIDMCSKLGIEKNNTKSGKVKTKKELYEAIIQYF
jgi:hypothetical protein